MGPLIEYPFVSNSGASYITSSDLPSLMAKMAFTKQDLSKFPFLSYFHNDNCSNRGMGVWSKTLTTGNAKRHCHSRKPSPEGETIQEYWDSSEV